MRALVLLRAQEGDGGKAGALAGGAAADRADDRRDRVGRAVGVAVARRADRDRGLLLAEDRLAQGFGRVAEEGDGHQDAGGEDDMRKAARPVFAIVMRHDALLLPTTALSHGNMVNRRPELSISKVSRGPIAAGPTPARRHPEPPVEGTRH